MLFFFCDNNKTIQDGTILFYRENTEPLVQNDTALKLVSEAKNVLNSKLTTIKKLDENSEVEALIEYIAPPVSLVIVGAGNDVRPLVKTAEILGWEIVR
ncbi:hypothetical protein AB9T88_11300 [Flavobacterium sp. LBUM151]